MANINVNRKSQDPYYRYKMPKIVGKVEGRGNGIKTVLINVTDVAKSINVPPEYPTKYLGMELGAHVQLDTRNDKYIINGSHIDAKLQELLYEFIDRYIICPECQNPETYLEIKNEKIKQSCLACGNSILIKNAYKFNTYILKHPPENKNHYQVSKVKNDEKTNADKINGKNNENSDTKCNVDQNVEWMTDTSAEGVQSRMKELSKFAAELTINDDLEKGLQERCIIFKKLIEKDIDNFDKVFHEAKRLELEDKAIIVVCELIFGDIPSSLEKYKDLIAGLVKDENSQRNLISSIEIVVANNPQKWVPVIGNIFHFLFNNDLVEEDTFHRWDSRRTKRYLGSAELTEKVHKSAKPFLNWLLTAEEESESDDIQFEEDTAKSANIIDEKYKNAPVKKQESDDDINIDDI